MIIDKLIELLATVCPVVIEQGSMAQGDRYPARFFTYWNPQTDDHKHYDNKAYGYTWTMQVNAYSSDPMEVYRMLEAARELLLQAGWKINGKGYAVASDHNTHTGRGFTAIYLET